jgi:hypothetical protein
MIDAWVRLVYGVASAFVALPFQFFRCMAPDLEQAWPKVAMGMLQSSRLSSTLSPHVRGAGRAREPCWLRETL